MPDGSLITQNGSGSLTGVVILDSNWDELSTQDFGGVEVLHQVTSDQNTYFYVITVPSGTPTPYNSKLHVLNRTTAAIVKTIVLATT